MPVKIKNEITASEANELYKKFAPITFDKKKLENLFELIKQESSKGLKPELQVLDFYSLEEITYLENLNFKVYKMSQGNDKYTFNITWY